MQIFSALNSKYVPYLKEKWQHAGFQKYLKNTGWMLAARITTFITSFFTVAIVARYLGPENLGKIDYAQSFVAIISVFASLGIDHILYRDLVANPEKENEILGTAIFSKLFFGAISFILAIIISILLGDQIILTGIIGICAFTFIVGPIGTVGILFSAKVKAQYSSQISIFIAFFIPALKLLVVFLNKGIIYFAFIILIEAIISASWSIFIYINKFKGSPSLWKFNFNIFKRLMNDSWPLLLASLSGYVYAKIDQVMLMHYINSATVGIYSAAVKLTQVWSFLPGLIIGSLFPAIVNAKKTNFALYAKRFKNLSFITIGITIAIAMPLYIFAPIIIRIIFGQDYIGAVPILRIYMWISLAITLTALAQNYFIVENFTKIFLYTSLIGATINILLNIILIPLYGSTGSAWGTMISYMSVVLSLFFFKDPRDGIIKMIK
jgi:O-antigen/teichoic acid export membrane protein